MVNKVLCVCFHSSRSVNEIVDELTTTLLITAVFSLTIQYSTFSVTMLEIFSHQARFLSFIGLYCMELNAAQNNRCRRSVSND